MDNEKNEPEWVSPAKLAKELSVSAQTLRRMAKDGKIPSKRIGKQFRLDRTAILGRKDN